MAAKKALKDLQVKGAKEGIEGAYLINPKTGRINNYVKGSGGAVNPYLQMNINAKDELEYLQKAQKAPRNVLHNHPGATSLSAPDIFNSTKRNQTYAINETGSIFRGYKLKNYEENLHTIQPTMIAADILEKHPNIDQYDLEFLSTHLTNKKMQKEGYIFYRSNLSKNDKRILKKYNSTVDEIVNAPLSTQDEFLTRKIDPKIRERIYSIADDESLKKLKNITTGNVKRRNFYARRYLENNVFGYRERQKELKNMRQLNRKIKELKTKLDDPALDRFDKWTLEGDLDDLLSSQEMSKEAIKLYTDNRLKDNMRKALTKLKHKI